MLYDAFMPSIEKDTQWECRQLQDVVQLKLQNQLDGDGTAQRPGSRARLKPSNLAPPWRRPR
jgi:hypothetical protein